MLDLKAQLTVDVIAEVTQGKVFIINAAKLLNKSRQAIKHYLQQYQHVGIQFVVNRNIVRVLSN